jgi:surface antigen
MRGWGANAKSLLLGSVLVLSCQFTPSGADAAPSTRQHTLREPTAQISSSGHYTARGNLSYRGRTYAGAGGGLSCVPFARIDSGILVAGNAWQWWNNAAGLYARGSVPEPGSVLAFRSNGRMRLGHVAVVSRVINPREIEVEHANWPAGGMRGAVARNIPVVDVSEANDWTAVRVGLGQAGGFGSVYPTYGFIYDRPDTGTMLASSATPAPQPALSPAPSDLRPAAERGWQAYEEVAEVPAVSQRHKRGSHPAVVPTRQVVSLVGPGP